MVQALDGFYAPPPLKVRLKAALPTRNELALHYMLSYISWGWNMIPAR
jgi:hypothetical protein